MSPVTAHPVAALLTEEMRARVASATFTRRRSPNLKATVTAKIGRNLYCPLGVALGDPKMRFPLDWEVANALGVGNDGVAYVAIIDFIRLVDRVGIDDPADTYALLGVERAP